jgi:photosystem II stability/assembly factor-like uncharacterized protein
MFGADSAIAAGDAGTIVRTSNSGATWSVQDHAGGLANIYAMRFLDANTGFIAGDALSGQGVGEGVLMKTTDGGQTWIRRTTSTMISLLYSIFFRDANNGWIVGSGGAFLQSTDGGNTWNQKIGGVPSGLHEDLHDIFFLDSNTGLAVGSSGTILLTTDGGRSGHCHPGCCAGSISGYNAAAPGRESLLLLCSRLQVLPFEA